MSDWLASLKLKKDKSVPPATPPATPPAKRETPAAPFDDNHPARDI